LSLIVQPTLFSRFIGSLRRLFFIRFCQVSNKVERISFRTLPMHV
jgi:hypothetical protein